MKKTLRSLIAGTLAAAVIVASMPLVPQISAEAAGTSSASLEAIDAETKGNWNGKYGQDGYILFGYNGREADNIRGDAAPGFREVALYEYDLVKAPDYLEPFENGAYYQVGAGASISVQEAPAQGDGYLEPPADSGLEERVFARYIRGELSAGEDTRTFQFKLKDNEEHLFSVYSTDYVGMKYFAIYGENGEELVPQFMGANEGATGTETYLTFRVRGSFTFSFHGSWSEGPSGVFFDPVPETEEPSGSDTSALIATDKTTQGNWKNTYGKDGALLLGYQYPDEVPMEGSTWGWTLIPSAQYDYEALPSYVASHDYNVNGDLWAKGASQDDPSLLQMPDGLTHQRFNAYGGGGGQARFTFTISDNEYHQFSVYCNQVPQNDPTFTITDLSGNVIVPAVTVPRTDFQSGMYLVYFVKGSFNLLVDKPDTDMMFGPQAFFFDPVVENRLSNLQAVEQGNRSARLTWENPENTEVVIERSIQGENQFEIVASLPAGTTEYIDSDLSTQTTYEYRLRALYAGSYSQPSAVTTCTIPAYQETVLTFLEETYAVEDAGTEVTVQAQLTCGNTPLSDKTIFLSLEGANAGSVWPEPLEATTDLNGIVSWTFTPDFLGSYTLLADFAVDDADQLEPAQARAAFQVGSNVWKKPPVIYRLSDAILPDNLISINGFGFQAENPDELQVLAALTTGNAGSTPPADAIELPIQQIDSKNGNFIVAQLPVTAQPGIYDVWVKNAYGWSTPVLLNGPRPLFLSEKEAWEGQILTISGRNLQGAQFGAKTDTLVRLVEGSASYPQNIIKCTPYSIKYEVNAPAGSYQVEVSNDGGKNWAAITGQSLQVVAAGQDPLDLGVAWAGHYQWDNRYDVTDYGANGTDTLDDTQAIQQAVNAAHEAGGGIVEIPAGTFYVDSISMPQGVVILGAGKGQTYLYYNGPGKNNMFVSADDGITGGQQGFACFSIRLCDDEIRPDAFFWLGHPWGDEAGDTNLRKPSEFFLHEIDLDYDLTHGFTTNAEGDPHQGMRGYAVVIVAKERFLVSECDFSGWSAGICHAYVNAYSAYLNNTFCYRQHGYVQATARYFFAEGNTISGPGWQAGSSMETHGIFARSDSHMEDNFVQDVGSDVNDGETYCCDSPGGNLNSGDIVMATATTITAAPLIPLQDTYPVAFNRLCIMIVDGRGLGQIRDVASIDASQNLITVTEPWTILPDATSRYTLVNPNSNVTIYNNEAENCSKGIYIFGNTYDVVVANNRQTDTEGVFIWTALIKNQGTLVPAQFTTILNNELHGISPKTQTLGIDINAQRYGSQGKYYGVHGYGLDIRGNTLTGVRGSVPQNTSEFSPVSGITAWAGLKSSDPFTDSLNGDITNVVVENNILRQFDTAINLSSGDYGIILKGNTFEDVGKEVSNTGEPEMVLTLTSTEYVPVTANKELLQTTYDYALTCSTEGVTDSAKAFFEKVLAQASAVLENETATQEEVDTAWKNLLEGIQGLGIVQGDKTQLNLLIEQAQTMIANQDRYVQTYWKNLEDALDSALLVSNDGDATEDVVKDASEILLDAILMQRYKANKENLQKLIDEINDMDLSVYTDTSVKQLKAVLQSAMQILNDETLSEEEQPLVTQAEKELMDAKNALELKEISTTPEDSDGDPSNPPANNPETPATGDDRFLLVLVLEMTLFSAGAVWYLRRKTPFMF